MGIINKVGSEIQRSEIRTGCEGEDAILEFCWLYRPKYLSNRWVRNRSDIIAMGQRFAEIPKYDRLPGEHCKQMTIKNVIATDAGNYSLVFQIQKCEHTFNFVLDVLAGWNFNFLIDSCAANSVWISWIAPPYFAYSYLQFDLQVQVKKCFIRNDPCEK